MEPTPPPPSWSNNNAAPPPPPPQGDGQWQPAPPPPAAQQQWQPAPPNPDYTQPTQQYSPPPPGGAFGTPPQPSASGAPKKAGPKVLALVGATVAILGGAFVLTRGKDTPKVAATTTTVAAPTTAEAVTPLTTARKILKTTTTVADPVATDPAAADEITMTAAQFAEVQSVVLDLAKVDVTPYEECIRTSPYSQKLLDATLMVCIEDKAQRLAYISAALEKAGTSASVTPSFLDCYQAKVVAPEFADLLSQPVGTGTDEVDAWGLEQFKAAGLSCKDA